MKIHPLLDDDNAVLISHTPVDINPTKEDFEKAGYQVISALQVELSAENIVFKPNETSAERFANPDTGITTHPNFIGGMIKYLKQHGAKKDGVFVVEDPLDSDNFVPRTWLKTGFPEMAKETGAKLCCPISYYCKRVEIENPLVHPYRKVTRYVTNPNTIVINVPKMKTHNLAITSLCFKNLMGLDEVFERHYCSQAWGELPKDKVKADVPKNQWMDADLHELWQAGLARRLIDLSKAIPTHLNIVEGVIARDGTGFNRGRNYPLGYAVAGKNMVAVDSAASYLMGFDPQKIVYLKMAASEGLGINDIAKLKIYTVLNGEVIPCNDVGLLQSKTKFRVIRDILGERESDFDTDDQEELKNQAWMESKGNAEKKCA